MTVMIGLSAFMVEDVSAFMWIYQKLAFIFGGMLIPLDFYPQVAADHCQSTPLFEHYLWTRPLVRHTNGGIVCQCHDASNHLDRDSGLPAHVCLPARRGVSYGEWRIDPLVE